MGDGRWAMGDGRWAMARSTPCYACSKRAASTASATRDQLSCDIGAQQHDGQHVSLVLVVSRLAFGEHAECSGCFEGVSLAYPASRPNACRCDTELLPPASIICTTAL